MALVQHHAMIDRSRPHISVCIANYNGELLLPDCLDSVLGQSADYTLQIIVHDDASRDASVALLQERYPQVELLVSDVNVGFCAANNRMAQCATGEILLLLNNDAALLPGAIGALASAMHQRPGIWTLPQFDWQSGGLVDRGCRIDPFCNPVPRGADDEGALAYVIGACMALPTALWRDLGGFPEWFESIAEDMYLCAIARQRGVPVGCTQTSGYRHRQGASFGGNRAGSAGIRTTFRRRRLSERNKTRVLYLTTPTAFVWPLLILHLTLLAAEGMVLCMVTRSHAPWQQIYWPAIAGFLRELGRLHRLRRELQRACVTGIREWMACISLAPRKFALLRKHGIPRVGS